MSFPLFEQPVTSRHDGIPIHLIGRSVLPSDALRQAGKSTGSMGGTMLSGLEFREFGYDSDIEGQWVLQKMQDPAVARVEGQCVRSSYLDANGVTRTTVWDLLVTGVNGSRELISVKKLEVAMKEEFRANWKRICAGVEPGVADSAHVATEYNLDRVKVDRGWLFNKALADGQPKYARRAFEFIAAQAEPITIAMACDFLRTEFPVPEDQHFVALSIEFWTVIWLLAKRAIETCTNGFLTMQSQVVLS